MNFPIQRRILRLLSIGLMAVLAGPVMAQMTLGAKGGLKIKPDQGDKALPGQQIATLELTLAADARKPGSRGPVREVLDRGLVVRNTGRDAMPVVYVGYLVKGGRIVNRSVSKPSLLKPGTHRVPAGRFLPGVEIRSGSGDGIIAGSENLWSVDGGIIAGKESIGDILNDAIGRDRALSKEEQALPLQAEFLVLFVVPDDAMQRRNVGIRAVTIKLDQP